MCDDKFSSWNNNVRNFATLLKKLNGTKFIYASSSSVYGNTTQDEIDEEFLDFSPINFYDMAKLHIDHLAKLSDTEYYGLRFGTVNGPAPHIRTDVMINAMTNTAAARSRILDTDYAAETAELARTQIIQQAATAMLAQANQQPHTVLALLQ